MRRVSFGVALLTPSGAHTLALCCRLRQVAASGSRSLGSSFIYSHCHQQPRVKVLVRTADLAGACTPRRDTDTRSATRSIVRGPTKNLAACAPCMIFSGISLSFRISLESSCLPIPAVGLALYALAAGWFRLTVSLLRQSTL